MEEFLSLSINLHASFIYIAIALAILNVYILKGDSAKRKFLGFLPLYYAILTCIAFTGLVLINFVQNWLLVSVMIGCWVYILVSTIKCYKLTKTQKILDKNSLHAMRRKYYIDIAIYIVFFIIERF